MAESNSDSSVFIRVGTEKFGSSNLPTSKSYNHDEKSETSSSLAINEGGGDLQENTLTLNNPGRWNTVEEGEASREGEGHRSEPQRHLPNIFWPSWGTIFAVSSTFSLFLDPLMCYIPSIVEKDTCYFWDKWLMWTFFVLRSIGDLLYALDIVVFLKRFPTKYSDKSSSSASSTETTDDHLSRRIFIHKMSDWFLAILLFRICVALPVLQAILLIGKYTYFDHSMLILLIPFQYTLRAYHVYKWLDRRANVAENEIRWLNGLLHFLPPIIASHIYGSMWYFLAVNREIKCWLEYICKHDKICGRGTVDYSFHCGYSSQKNNKMISISGLKQSCPVELPKNMISFPFDYGIYLPALQSNMTTSRDLPRKILHCFWWGLRNLSSFGSNLQTSFYAAEIMFSVMISISGLALFLVYLNSRVQQGLVTMRGLEKMAEQRRLRQKMKKIYSNLIKKTRIMSPLHMDAMKKVPILGRIREEGLKAISEHLKPNMYTRDEYIIRKGEPLRKMLFIWHGTALSYTTTKGATTSVCKCLEKNDFCGEELVNWALKSASFSELPICTTTLVSQSKVEAFSITANHLKSVVDEFWWHFRWELPHSRLEYFAASSIQAAWRRYHAKKLRYQLAGTNN